MVLVRVLITRLKLGWDGSSLLLSIHTASILVYGNNVCLSLAFRKIDVVYSAFYGFVLYQSPDIHQ